MWASNSKRNWAKFGVGFKLIVILRHIIAYFSINIRWHSQNVSSDSRKWLIKHLFPPSSCKKQINKQNSYLLLAFLQSGSVPELDMHESKHFLPGQFVHSVMVIQWLLYFTLFIVYVLIINVVSCPPGALIWKIKYLVSCIQINSISIFRTKFLKIHFWNQHFFSICMKIYDVYKLAIN